LFTQKEAAKSQSQEDSFTTISDSIIIFIEENIMFRWGSDLSIPATMGFPNCSGFPSGYQGKNNYTINKKCI